MDTLSYRVQTRKGMKDGSITMQERVYIDFIISGKPFLEIVNAEKNDTITMLGWHEYMVDEEFIVNEFLKTTTPTLKSGRTMIYGCPECADIDCGAITAEIVDAGNKIIWKDLGFETSYELDLERFKHIGPFEFDKQKYTNAFTQILKEINALPHEKY